MNSEKVMLEKLYSILNEFKNPKYSIEQEIYSKIRDFNNEVFKGKDFPLKSEFYYEEVAFIFMETGEESNLPGWEGLHYGPVFSAKDEKGNIISNPGIKNITPEMVNYLERRSFEVDNPILRCRYAGLVWDFSQKIRNSNPDISNAYRFIDSIIEMSYFGGDCFLKYKLGRALKLAISINDQKRIICVRDAIIKYEEIYSEEAKPGTWGYSYDLLIGDKKLYSKVQLNKKQEDKIIATLESKLNKFSDKKLKTFNTHCVECIITRLAPYYKNKNDVANMRRILLVYRDSFLHGVDSNLIMAGSHCLEKVRKILFQYNLSEEAKKLEPKIRSLQKEELKNLKKHEIATPISQQAIDDCISKLNKGRLSEALNCIAVSFIPNKEMAKNMVLKIAKEHPLSFIIPRVIIGSRGRVVAKIGPIEDDLEGHIVHQMSQSMNFYLHWLTLGLQHLEENRSLNANSLSEHLFRSSVFPKANHQIIKEGVTTYFNKNYIASCSILTPQIESAIRELVSVAGGAIYQASSNSQEKGFELRPLGTLLRDKCVTKTFEQVNNNIPYYFQILLTDKRGLNIRNIVCHGDCSADGLNQDTAIFIIHILLILSMLRKKTSSHKTGNS